MSRRCRALFVSVEGAQIIFRRNAGDRALSCCVDNLSHIFAADIAGRHDPGQRSPHLLISNDKAAVIIQLIKRQHLHIGADADQDKTALDS